MSNYEEKYGWLVSDLNEMRDKAEYLKDDMKTITNGFDEHGNQQYTKWYLHHNPLVTHWMPLPEPPKGVMR